MSFVCAAFMSQAAVNPKIANPKEELSGYFLKNMLSEVKTVLDTDTPGPSKNQACTVTLKGTISTGVFSIEVSCTSTETSCEQATKIAASCLSTAVKTTREILF